MTPQTVIRTRNLGKEFGDTRALFGVDLEIEPGSVIGVLGPNGSGKTTLLKQIIGLQWATWGQAEVFGIPANKLKESQTARIGYVSQDSQLLEYLTVGETLRFARAHYPTWDDTLADRLVDEYKLDHDRKAGRLSQGQKQRLGIILGVSHRPELLLLDEPAASLDPVVRQDFLNLLMELIQDEGRTILISSHILTDVRKVIDKVLILEAGQVRCFTDLDTLQEEYHHVALTSLQGPLPDEISLSGLMKMERKGAGAIATVHQKDGAVLRQELQQLGCQSRIKPLDFEEIYRLIVAGR